MNGFNNAILIVEDEKNLGSTLNEYLTSTGYHSYWATNVKSANELFNKHRPDIVLMDINLPDGNGLELAKEFRQRHKGFVLLFLSAQNDPETKVSGLEIGADDYITKPFALKELTLRLERIMKNKRDISLPEEISIGKLKIWFNRFEILDGKNQVLSLSQKECFILLLLYKNRGDVVSRDTLISEIWGEDQFPSNRTVDNYIVKLRRWSESDSTRQLEIQSIRGIGYKLIVHKE